MVKIKIKFRKEKTGTSSQGQRELTTLQLLWKTWSGKISITLIVIMILLALFSIVYYTPNGMKDYEKSPDKFTYLYPERAPPCWIVDSAPGLFVSDQQMKHTFIMVTDLNQISDDTLSPRVKKTLRSVILYYNGAIINETYEYVFNYSAEGYAKPSDTGLALVYKFGNNTIIKMGNNRSITLVFFNIYLERPDGVRIHFFKGKFTPSPGNVTSVIGDVQYNVTFINKQFEKFYKTFSLNSLAGSNLTSTTPIAQYLANEYPAVAQQIVGNDTELIQDFIKQGYGVALYLTPAEDGKFKVLSGQYKLHVELVYVVPKDLVVSNGEYDPVKAKNNDAIIETRAIAYRILPNCYGMFGTDSKSRPIGMGLLFGLPYAFLLGFIVTFTSTFIGAFYGSAAGYWKDVKGEAMMRVVDIFNSLPFLPILIALSVAVGTINLYMLALLMIALFWAGPVIVVRSMSLQISEQIYVEAAKAIGASTRRILFKHVFPQVFPYTMAIAVLSMPGVIIAEASLALLGFGDPNAPTWGKILQAAYESQAVQNGMWWVYIFPGLALVIFSAAFLLLGRALEPIVAPKLIK